MSQKRYLEIVDFDKVQMYKDRNPIWIKLYCSLLDDYQFAQIPDETKFHAVGLMILAARLNNKLPDDEGWLRLKIGANSEINLKVLLEIRFLQPVKGARSGAKKSFNGSNSNNPKGELVNEPEKLCNLEQNRTEQKRTEHNTTEQTRTETDDAAAEQSGVVLCVDLEKSQTGESGENRQQAAHKNNHLSEFSIAEILRYVQHCVEKGDAIKNPQGLAANLYQTGNADAFIRAALYPEQQKEIDREIYGEPRAFTGEPCVVCFGAKMSDPDGKGFRPCDRCKNERGRSTGYEPEASEERRVTSGE